MKFIDLCGRRFGRLVATKYLGRMVRPGTTFKTSYYECMCDCGTPHTVAATALRYGRTESCGCSKRHYEFGKPSYSRSGKSRTPEYMAWINIRRRCYDKSCAYYPKYGGRGIEMHAPWIHSFAEFYAYVGDRPSPAHSIDRIDNNGHYAPGNVRWATRSQQCRNRRSSRWLTMDGVTRTMVEWAEHLGIPYAVMKSRIRHGWTLESIRDSLSDK